MLSKITNVTLFVNDQEAALQFYKKVGFSVHTDAMFGPSRWLTLCLPDQKDVEFTLLLAETAQEKALVGKQGADKPFLSLASTDCHKDYAHLKAAGIEFVEAPKEEPWGISTAFKDLYGNVVYLWQPK